MIYLFHVDKHFQFYYICMYSHLLNTFLIKQVFILILCLLMIPCQKLNVVHKYMWVFGCMKICNILLLVTDANMYETGTINEKIISNDLKKTQNACIQFTSVTFGHILRHNLLYSSNVCRFLSQCYNQIY